MVFKKVSRIEDYVEERLCPNGDHTEYWEDGKCKLCSFDYPPIPTSPETTSQDAPPTQAKSGDNGGWMSAFGVPTESDSGVAAKKFGFVPTSILDFTNDDRWQLRDPSIRTLMEAVGTKRGLVNTGGDSQKEKTFIATAFNSGLCRFIVRYYFDAGQRIIDPFAGWGTRAYVCRNLGLDYTGFEVVADTVDVVNASLHRVAQASLTGEKVGSAVIRLADGIRLDGVQSNSFDALLTCPPYHDREVYGDADPRCGGPQLSRLGLENFENQMRRGFKRWYEVLRTGSFAIFVSGDWRDKGRIYPFTHRLWQWATEAGFTLHDVAVHRLRGTIALGIGTFMPARFVPRSHETIQVFKK